MLDEKDTAIRDRLAKLYLERIDPQTGDFVRFQNGITRRIAWIWGITNSRKHRSIQTCDYGSFHLSDHGASMSGSLYRGIEENLLQQTTELKQGQFWIFHHNYVCAGGGVDFKIPVRVWECRIDAPIC